MSPRPPLPPFTEQTARQKVQAAEDAWNTRDPERVAGAYSEDSVWRNRHEFLTGRAQIIEFLSRKWSRELDYALRKDLWSFHGNRIAVRFQYESHDAAGQWYRSYGNELWEFDEDGLMRRREASINDVAIDESERRIFGPRPEEERGQSFPLREREFRPARRVTPLVRGRARRATGRRSSEACPSLDGRKAVVIPGRGPRVRPSVPPSTRGRRPAGPAGLARLPSGRRRP